MTGSTFYVGSSSTKSIIGGLVGRAFEGATFSDISATVSSSTFQSDSSLLSLIGIDFAGFGHNGNDMNTTLGGTNTIIVSGGTTLSGGANAEIGGVAGDLYGDSSDVASNVTVNLVGPTTFSGGSSSKVGSFGGSDNGSSITITGVTTNVGVGVILSGTSVNTVNGNIGGH